MSLYILEEMNIYQKRRLKEAVKLLVIKFIIAWNNSNLIDWTIWNLMLIMKDVISNK